MKCRKMRYFNEHNFFMGNGFDPNKEYIEAEDFTRMESFSDTKALQKCIEERTFVLIDPDLFNFSFVL